MSGAQGRGAEEGEGTVECELAGTKGPVRGPIGGVVEDLEDEFEEETEARDEKSAGQVDGYKEVKG